MEKSAGGLTDWKTWTNRPKQHPLCALARMVVFVAEDARCRGNLAEAARIVDCAYKLFETAMHVDCDNAELIREEARAILGLWGGGGDFWRGLGRQRQDAQSGMAKLALMPFDLDGAAAVAEKKIIRRYLRERRSKPLRAKSRAKLSGGGGAK